MYATVWAEMQLDDAAQNAALQGEVCWTCLEIELRIYFIHRACSAFKLFVS